MSIRWEGRSSMSEAASEPKRRSAKGRSRAVPSPDGAGASLVQVDPARASTRLEVTALASTASVDGPKRSYTVRRGSRERLAEERAEHVYQFHFEGRSGKYRREGDAKLESAEVRDCHARASPPRDPVRPSVAPPARSTPAHPAAASCSRRLP